MLPICANFAYLLKISITVSLILNCTGGNVSVLLGFLNVFLWSANTWFLYKETRMYNPNRGKHYELGN